ncbi:FAD-dependent oxidoreductase [Nocardia fusca]|uniref:FAD-dependent oxidoreductase n=1 Tax=Nocardia fusca TaxID=941183 RepID=UPI0037A18BA3
MKCDVVVMGPGTAGLVAAERLSRAGCSVRVPEARDRVGGRTLNADIGGGKIVEVGGQFIGPGQHTIGRIVTELGLATFGTHDEGTHLLELFRTGPVHTKETYLDIAEIMARLEAL